MVTHKYMSILIYYRFNRFHHFNWRIIFFSQDQSMKVRVDHLNSQFLSVTMKAIFFLFLSMIQLSESWKYLYLRSFKILFIHICEILHFTVLNLGQHIHIVFHRHRRYSRSSLWPHIKTNTSLTYSMMNNTSGTM